MFASALSRLSHACRAVVGHRRSLIAVVVAVGAGLAPVGEVGAGVTGSVTANPTTIAPGASTTVRVTATVTDGTLPGAVDVMVSEGANATGRVTITDVAVVQGSLSCTRTFDVLFSCEWSTAAVGDTVAFDVTAMASTNASGPFVFSVGWLDQQGLSQGGIGGDGSENIMVVAPTSTTLASSLNPAPFSEAVTFTATVSAGDVPVAAGTVTFSDETTATPLGGPVTVDGNGQASLTTSTLSAGAHHIVAAFNGTPALKASISDPLTQQIDTPQADLAITKTDGVTSLPAGGSVTYTITVSNAGPSDVTGATVADTFPASLTASWTCVGAGSGTCTTAGSGNIDDTVDLPIAGSVTYTVSVTLDPFGRRRAVQHGHRRRTCRCHRP